MITEVQIALYAALSAALDVPVYDAPEGADYPYVTIDAIEVQPVDYLVERMDRYLVYLTIWSNYAGKKEVAGIASTIYDTLHRQRLTLTAGSLVDMQVSSRRINRDVDELTYSGSLTVELRVQH